MTRCTKTQKSASFQRTTSAITAMVAFSLVGAGCTDRRKDVTHIEKVSQTESQVIQARILHGEKILPTHVLSKKLPGSPAEECAEFMSTLPKDMKRGYLEVPESWTQASDPAARKIKVFYYGNVTPGAKAPVIFFNGGPAGDSHSSYEVLKDKVEEAGLPFIYIDQRGTGCSDPFPAEPTLETAQRLTNYTSRSIVLDSEALRKNLFGAESRWKVFGQSFGGQIVHRYATIAPEGILSAHAHGLSLMNDPAAWMKMRIESQRRVLADYLSVYPDDEERLQRFRAAIPADRCFTDGDTEICGNSVVDAAVFLLGFKSSWQNLHEILVMLTVGGDKVGVNDGVVKWWVRELAFGVAGNNYFAGSVISKVEMNHGQADPENCAEVMKRMEAEGETPANWLLNECRLLSGMKNKVLDALVASVTAVDSVTLTDFSASLEKFPSLKFFLYSGRKDVFVPEATFAEEQKFMGSRIQYTAFPDSGHEGFESESQVWDELKAE